MRPPRRLVMLVFVLVAFLPRPAFAHIGWWDFLEELSGPGPFDKHELFAPALPFSAADVRLFCRFDQHRSDPADKPRVREWVPLLKSVPSENVRGAKVQRPCLTHSDQATRFVELRYGQVSTVETPLFNDTPSDEAVGVVTAHNVQVFLMRELHDSIAVGPGAGVLWFTGQPAAGQPDNLTSSVLRPIVTPVSVIFRPLQLFTDVRWANLVSFRAEEILLFGYEAKDFNENTTSRFRAGTELRTSFSIAFDFSPLFR